MKYNKKVVEKIDRKQWKCVCCVKVYSNETNKNEHQQTQKHQVSYAHYKREEDEMIVLLDISNQTYQLTVVICGG